VRWSRAKFAQSAKQLLEKLQEGAVLKGVVKNLTDYGAFVDLGGIDGLLHITDMAWKRVRHPSEVVNVGAELDVRVLKYDRERNRVSLGLKQLGEDPWDNIARRYPTNTRVFGKVSNVTDYGAFVEIEPGVEGLVHVSEMDWTNKNVNPAKVVQVGDEVQVMVLDVDEERPPHLARHQAGHQPIRGKPSAAIHKKGDKVSGQIKSITDFGIFIGLDGGIDGLVHLSDISWNPPAKTSCATSRRATRWKPWCWPLTGARAHFARREAARTGPDGHLRGDQCPGSIVKGIVKEGRRQGRNHRTRWWHRGYIARATSPTTAVDDASKVPRRSATKSSEDRGHRPQGPACSCRSRRRTSRTGRKPWPITTDPPPMLPAVHPSWVRCCANSWDNKGE
jgi:small subunit ribosomal protein S1